MKIFFVASFLLLFALYTRAQTVKVSGLSASTPIITINAKLIGKDSVIVPFTADYYLIQDECVQIIRYGHYDFVHNCFFGKFKDVSNNDHSQIIAEGGYLDGKKDGFFTFNYPDGKLMAKGIFKNDKYEGNWEFYYPNGVLWCKGAFADNNYTGDWKIYFDNAKLGVQFVDDNASCKIINLYNQDGKQLVNNGNGYYRSPSNINYWTGKITNGLPDSVWTLSENTALGVVVVVTEYFNKNIFSFGQAKQKYYSHDYYDVSHIVLLPRLPQFQIDNSRNLQIVTGCDGIDFADVYYKIWGETFHVKKTLKSGVLIKKKDKPLTQGFNLVY